MIIRKTNILEQPFRKSVAFMLVFYWAVLVAWQNISGTEARTTIDLVIKMGLLLYFCWFYLKRARTVSAKILWVMLLAVSLSITAVAETEFPLSNVVMYFYPVVFLAMVYGLGDKYEITKKQLITFCNWVIAITMYAAVYAIIFCWDQFASAFLITNAYNNELSSFFLSSHEYGMYLACAMISCGLCLKYDDQITPVKKMVYIAALVILALNLVLTFSRTSMAGLVVFLLVFIFVGKGSLKRWVLAGLVLVGLTILLSPKLSSFVYDIVLKRNNLAGRDGLFAAGIRYYQSGTFWEQIFGYGIQDTRKYFEYYLRHGSVHNAYLQILLYFGAVGLLYLLAFLLSQFWMSVKLLGRDHFFGAVSLGLTMMAMMMMVTNTQIVFTSPIDSYFLTMFMFVMPKYVRNAIRNDRFM